MKKVSLPATFAFLAFSTLCFADTVRVPADYPTIQAGIDAAVNGDTVLVAPGTYFENVVFINKKINVIGEQGPHATVIDGGQNGAVVAMKGLGKERVLEGFTVTNGSGYVSSPNADSKGGGIYIIGGTVQNCIIMDNEAILGGGVFASHTGYKHIHKNLIVRNRAVEGGGIRAYKGIYTENTISYNIADLGGGVRCGSMSMMSDKLSEFYDNTLSRNAAQQGGGLFIGGSVAMVGNRISENVATYNGGGINHGNESTLKRFLLEITIENNVVAGNRALNGGGISGALSGQYLKVQVANNTVVYNEAIKLGGGFHSTGFHTKVYNSIFWGNSANKGKEILVRGDGCMLYLKYCNVQGGKASVFVQRGGWLNWGVGMMDEEPCFADPACHDYHLLYTSHCRDAGDSDQTTQVHDCEGDPRVAGTCIDIGADEFHPHLYFKGGANPSEEITACITGCPGQSIVLCLGTTLIDPPLATPFGLFYIDLPFTMYNGGVTPQSGLQLFESRIPAGTPAPSHYPMQALVGNTLTPLSWLNVSEPSSPE